jgi:hypothetical protein
MIVKDDMTGKKQYTLKVKAATPMKRKTAKKMAQQERMNREANKHVTHRNIRNFKTA